MSYLLYNNLTHKIIYSLDIFQAENTALELETKRQAEELERMELLEAWSDC